MRLPYGGQRSVNIKGELGSAHEFASSIRRCVTASSRPGVTLNADEKLEIARQLARPAWTLSRRAFPSPPRAISRRCGGSPEKSRPVIAALARADPWISTRPRRRLRPAESRASTPSSATSDIHLATSCARRPTKCVADGVDAVRLAKKFVDDVEFSAEDATRCDWDFLCRMFAVAIEAGATTINIPDTVGYTTPEEYGDLIRVHHGEYAGHRQRRHQRPLPRRPRHGGGQLAGGHRGGRATSRVLHQRHRRAGGQRGARRDRHGAAGPAGLLQRRDAASSREQIYRTSRLVSTLTGMNGPAEQGDRRRERLRARVGHPSGRRSERARRRTRS